MLLALLAHALPPSSTTWTVIADDPVKVECATVSGATWCRAFGHVAKGVDPIARIIEDRANYPRYYSHVAKTDLLAADVLRVELDLPPIIGDRDWVIRTSRVDEGSTRYYRWVPVPDGAPEVDGVLRLPQAAGEWQLTPDSAGTALRYTWQAEYGGHLPGWLLTRIRAETGMEMISNTQKAVGG